jgi:hypothetical protein
MPIFAVYSSCYNVCVPVWDARRWGDIMGTKRPKSTPTQQLEDLLKAHALRRLEARSPSTPKATKPKPLSKQKKKR